MKLLLVKFVITGLSIATLAACGAPETSQTSQTISPSPIASPSPKTTPEVTASPAPVESVAPPVTISSSSATPATNPPISRTTAPPIKISTATTGCYEAETALLQLTTKNYIINICGETTPQYYVGAEKANPANFIRLPLAEASPTFFMAVNGDTTYVLAQTPRGHFLTVTQGEKELLREVVEGW